MKKSVTNFVCQECGYDSPQWLGKCPECGVWNSLKEIHESRITNHESKKTLIQSEPKTLGEITSEEKDRMTTGFLEADGVFGGGIVPGSVTLLAGDPGVGKSTLLLQVALQIASVANENFLVHKAQKSIAASRIMKSANAHSENFVSSLRNNAVLYISAEESEEQVKLRASRISKNLTNTNLFLLSLTDTDAVVAVIEKTKPSLVIIDSIQTMESENLSGLSGSVGQVRYACSQFVKVAKANRIPIILVGHVTKEGMVAGPMVLSHMVDTVLFLEGEKTTQTRILRSLKNRFGPVDEVGVFFMEGSGMIEAKNPEQIFLTQNKKNAPGSVLTVILEGSRSFLVEVQALVVFSKLPIPRRVVSGIDSRRVELLLAVLQKHCRLSVDTMDVFVNVAGGIKIADPAADVAVCLAVFSSLKNISLADKVGIGEVGLLGELRRVGLLEKRVKEAKKLGFKQILSPDTHSSIRDVLESVIK